MDITICLISYNLYAIDYIIIYRLNSGIRNRQNFFPWAILSFQKIRTDSVNCADSGDTKILVQFPGNSILESSTNFWKCVGAADKRGRIPTRIYENA